MQKLEGFKIIEKYPNYAVSQYGNVISLNYNKTGKIKLMTPTKDTDGYLYVGLYKDGKQKNNFVHRLVYETWVGAIPDGYEINHIDENKENNRLDNLKAIPHKDNINWATHNERVAKANTNHPKRSKKVAQYTLSGELVNTYPSIKEVERVSNGKFNNSHISKCCNNRLKTAYGFIWRYV